MSERARKCGRSVTRVPVTLRPRRKHDGTQTTTGRGGVRQVYCCQIFGRPPSGVAASAADDPVPRNTLPGATLVHLRGPAIGCLNPSPPADQQRPEESPARAWPEVSGGGRGDDRLVLIPRRKTKQKQDLRAVLRRRKSGEGRQGGNGLRIPSVTICLFIGYVERTFVRTVAQGCYSFGGCNIIRPHIKSVSCLLALT